LHATEFYINNITNSDPGIVTLERGIEGEQRKHFFKDGDFVSF